MPAFVSVAALGLVSAAALGVHGAAPSQQPCDLYQAGGTPCVAAHSTVRALYRKFEGQLYQVKRSSDGATQDIPVLGAGGVANSSVQDVFCEGTNCVIQRIFDQSGLDNHLDIAGPGGAHRFADAPVNATKERLTVGGRSVYGAHFEGGQVRLTLSPSLRCALNY